MCAKLYLLHIYATFFYFVFNLIIMILNLVHFCVMCFMSYSFITHSTTTSPNDRPNLDKIKLKNAFYKVENLSFLHTNGIDNLYFHTRDSTRIHPIHENIGKI